MNKAEYTRNHIEPMLKALDSRIKQATYRCTESAEFIDIAYGFNQKMHVCVTADSLAQMTIDVIKAVII